MNARSGIEERERRLGMKKKGLEGKDGVGG